MTAYFTSEQLLLLFFALQHLCNHRKSSSHGVKTCQGEYVLVGTVELDSPTSK